MIEAGFRREASENISQAGQQVSLRLDHRRLLR
jgi:hypothetical protein